MYAPHNYDYYLINKQKGGENYVKTHINTAREIINAVDSMEAPQGKNEADWKYDRVHSRLLPLIMNM